MSCIRRYAKQIPCLMYHNIFKDGENTSYPESPYIISPKKFQEQMCFLCCNNFHTITLKELEKYLNNQINLPKNSVLITFDDGNKCSCYYGYPILEKYSFKAVNFLITSIIKDKTEPFNPAYMQYLSWNEINACKDVFEFACHTHNLHNYNDAGTSYLLTKSKEEVINDLKTSLDLLKTKYFSYPFGQYNDNAIEILKELGFTMAFTVNNGLIKPSDNMFLLKRNRITPQTTMADFKRIVGLG